MKRLAATALVLGLASSTPALADVMQLNSFAYSGDSGMLFNLTAKNASGALQTENNIPTGELQGTLNGKSFLTYCVDLFQTFGWGTTYDDKLTTDQGKYSLVSAGTNLLPWFTAGKATDLGRLFTGYSAQVKDAASSAAFQLATWAIISENGSDAKNYAYSLDDSASGFKIAASNATDDEKGAIKSATTWLSGLPGSSSYSIQVEYSSKFQDQVVASKVPEPAGYALAATALGLLALSRRRQDVRPAPLKLA